MPAHLENSAVATGLKMVSFHASPKEEKCQECSNCFTIALISHASKIMLKILLARLQWYMNQELPDVETGFRKGRGTRDQIANILWIIKKARELKRKNKTTKKRTSASLTMLKPLTAKITTSCAKFLERQNTRLPH